MVEDSARLSVQEGKWKGLSVTLVTTRRVGSDVEGPSVLVTCFPRLGVQARLSAAGGSAVHRTEMNGLPVISMRGMANDVQPRARLYVQ